MLGRVRVISTAEAEKFRYPPANTAAAGELFAWTLATDGSDAERVSVAPDDL